MNAFIQDPGHYYSGVNALMLRHLHLHLGGELKNPAGLRNLEGGVVWACLSAMQKHPKDYWARVSFADMNLLLSDTDTVVREYRNAVAAADRDWFALDSTRQQILILRDLGFRPEQVAAALDVLEEEIELTEPPWKPRQVFLFSGHMIDKAGREEPRFPADKESVAAVAIAAGFAVATTMVYAAPPAGYGPGSGGCVFGGASPGAAGPGGPNTQPQDRG